MNLVEEYRNFKLAAVESLEEGFPRESLVNVTYGNVLLRNLLRTHVENDLRDIDYRLKNVDKTKPIGKELMRERAIVVLADRLIVMHLNNINVDYNVFKLNDSKTVIKIESNAGNHENYKDPFVEEIREAFWTKTSTTIKIRCRSLEDATSRNPVRIEKYNGQVTAVFNIEPWNGVVKYSDGKDIRKMSATVETKNGTKKYRFLVDQNPIKNYIFKENSWTDSPN